MRKSLPALLALVAFASCVPRDAIPIDDVLKELDRHIGKRVTVKTRLRSGARCRVGDEEGEFRTYCKDCQYCRGPLVIDGAVKSEAIDDWPMILGGTWEGADIRCKGPLHKVKCAPFEPGRLYVIRGRIEASHPPKLLVQKFWEVGE